MKARTLVVWTMMMGTLCGAVLSTADTCINRTASFYNTSVPQLTSDRGAQQLIAAIYKDPRAKQLKISMLQKALSAYERVRKRGIMVQKPVITVIDYSMPSSQKRLWVIDLTSGKILFNSLVAHGKNSGSRRYAVHFSNNVNSLQTSLGVFLTADTYSGRDGYSLKLKGLERGVNDNALKRHIVMHGASYVSNDTVKITGCVGRSWGCPAIEPKLVKPIIDTIKGGSIIFAYYPDLAYLSTSTFLNG